MERNERPLTIGYHAPYVGGGFFRQVRSGAYDVLRASGARLVDMQAPLADVASQGLGAEQIDGWLSLVSGGGAERLIAAGRPVVTISYRVPGATAVLPDNVGGARAAMAHLVALGHRRIAFVGEADSADVMERLDGYRAVLSEAGLPIDHRLVEMVPTSARRRCDLTAAQLLTREPAITAIVAGDDDVAFGLIAGLRAAGRRIPEDIAVVGFDDNPDAQSFTPPLTTVRQSYGDLGRTAARTLIAQLQGSEPSQETVRVPTQLIVRASCGSARRIARDAAAEGGQEADRGTAPGAPGWQIDLARRLVALVRHPIPVTAHERPEQIWPGVSTLIEAVDAALDDRPAVADARLQEAWNAAIALAPYGAVLGQVIDTLEASAQGALDARGRDAAASARIADVRTHLRDQLTAASLGTRARQMETFEDSYYRTTSVSGSLLATPADAVHTLDWLRASDTPWACLALWDGEPGSDLQIVGTAPASVVVGRHVRASSFPPLDTLGAESDAVEVIRIKTARRDWGYIAVARVYDSEMSFMDMASRWVELLGARLDDGALRRELEQEREVLAESYERERSLADTVRELGCPVIPLGRGALLVPLIGSVDSRRAQQVIDTVLQAVSAERTVDVLLDVSGVPVIDTHVAGVLLQLAQMCGLLGARASLIGVRPEIAQSIVSLGVDLKTLTAYASLEDALRKA